MYHRSVKGGTYFVTRTPIGRRYSPSASLNQSECFTKCSFPLLISQSTTQVFFFQFYLPDVAEGENFAHRKEGWGLHSKNKTQNPNPASSCVMFFCVILNINILAVRPGQKQGPRSRNQRAHLKMRHNLFARGAKNTLNSSPRAGLLGRVARSVVVSRKNKR